jgi:hypothetical protein
VIVRVNLPLKEAALHYTTETKPINMREWKSVPAEIKGVLVVADAPPEDATLWFLTVTDEKGGVISSRMVIR